MAVAQGFRNQDLDRLLQQLVARIAEIFFHLRIDQDDAPFTVDDHNGVRRRLEQGAKPRFACPDRGFGRASPHTVKSDCPGRESENQQQRGKNNPEMLRQHEILCGKRGGRLVGHEDPVLTLGCLRCAIRTGERGGRGIGVQALIGKKLAFAGGAIDHFPGLRVAYGQTLVGPVRQHESPFVFGIGPQHPVSGGVQQPELAGSMLSARDLSQVAEEIAAQVIQHDDAAPVPLPIENRCAKTQHGLEGLFEGTVLDIEVQGRHIDFTLRQDERFAYIVATGFVLQLIRRNAFGMAVVPVDADDLPPVFVQKPDLVV